MAAPTPSAEPVAEKSASHVAPTLVTSSAPLPAHNVLSASSNSAPPLTPPNAVSPSLPRAGTTSSDSQSGSNGVIAAPASDEEAISYVNQEGEWKYRKINLFKVMRGFVSQLKPGQDLTKISLPAECCTPYGLLEVMGSRELAMFHLTFGMNRSPDSALERFFAALRFFFGTVRSERFDKKPWNPVLGETHITYADVIYGDDGVGTTETVPAASPSPSASKGATPAPASSSTAVPSSSNASSSSAKSRTIFVGEQVSHHPPVSAISLSNEREQVACNANVSFTVKFGGNQVTVATAGALQIVSKRFGETYELTKCLPDMVVRNVVWGKKYIMWEGQVTMTCPQTGYTAFLKFKEKSSQNVVKGYIMKGDAEEPLIELSGVAGERIMYHYLDGTTQPSQPTVFLDLTREPSARIRYLPKSKLAPLSSVGVWEKVNKAIVDDNISLADKEKKLIEQAQRERAKARLEMNQEYQGYHFDMSPEGIWTYKNNMDLQTVLKEGAHSIDPAPQLSDDESGDEFASNEDPEPLLLAQASDATVNGIASENLLSDPDRSPINSGDEDDTEELDTAVSSSSQLEIPSKRRRGSGAGLKQKGSSTSLVIGSPMVGSSSKKELRAEKKKAREEVKLVVTKMKEEKKKGTTTAALLEGQVYAGWCKVRNLMKKWKDRYIVILPGRLVIFRSPSEASKSSASGMLLLQGCDVRPRPSKKDGSCFKIFSLNQYPIYSRQGLKGESISSALLPVGSDYCILRCPDAASMNTWIEKIRACIPDWEKNRTLIKAAGLDLEDSDSDDDSDDSDMDAPNALLEVVPPSSLVPSSSNVALADATIVPGVSAPISNEEILNQIGQLYKITRKFSQRQRKHVDSMEEFRVKIFPEAVSELKKLSNGAPSSAAAASSSAAPGGRKNPFEKMKEAKAESKSNGIVGRVKAQFDIKTCVLLAVIFILIIHAYVL